MFLYIRRLLKFVVYFLFFFFLILGILPLILNGRPISQSFNELMSQRQFIIIICLMFAYALVYPVVTFIHIKRHLNGNFEDNRRHFEKAFEQINLVKVQERDSKLIYRKRSQLARALAFWEDEVIVDVSNNPVIIAGMRKTVYRLNRTLEQLMMHDQDFKAY